VGNFKSAKEEWNAIIASKLKEGHTLEDLKYEYAKGVSIEPNVMASDIEAYKHVVNVSKSWISMASIADGNSKEKNRLALQALQQGANGLSIALSNLDSITEILKDVLTAYLDVRIDCSALTAEETAIQKSGLSKSDFPNVRWIGIESEGTQLFIGEKDRVNAIKKCLNHIDPNIQTDVLVSLSKNLLFEIASLRALRALLDEMNIKSFNILAQYEEEGTNELGDYNLIEKTYKVISGILGGVDAILTPYSDAEESRLTLNIHNILDLESGMKNVLDPLSGAYYIEKLTGEIIRQVKENL
jgi:hypothetical protein